MKTMLVLIMLSIIATGYGIQAINQAEGLTNEQARLLDIY